jgi:gentisate 1,2-dioxygenase
MWSRGKGEGHSVVGGKRLYSEDTDVFTMPTWTFCEHVNSGDRSAFLFSFSDALVMRALSLYREETRQSAGAMRLSASPSRRRPGASGQS